MFSLGALKPFVTWSMQVKNQHAAGDRCFAAGGTIAGYSTFSWTKLPPSDNGKVSICMAALCS